MKATVYWAKYDNIIQNMQRRYRQMLEYSRGLQWIPKVCQTLGQKE